MGSPPKQAAALRPPRALLLALAFLVGALTVSLMLLGVPARDYALALGASVPAHQRAGCRPVFAATDDGDEAASTLGPEELALYRRLQAWQFAMPADALRRSMLQQGDLSRLRAAVGRALQGKPLRVFVAGGSITEGVGSLEREEGHGYVTRFFQFVNATFVPSGGRAHTLTNGGISATNSVMYDTCGEQLFSKDADVYVLELAVNDHNQIAACAESPKNLWDVPQRAAFERLLRRILSLPHKPALLLLNHYAYFASEGRFYDSTENDFNVLAAYYDVPSLSLRFAVWPLIMANAPGFRVELGKYCLNEHRGNKDNFCRKMRRKLAEQGVSLASINGDAQLYADRTHPADGTGHRYLAELLIHAVQQAAREAVQGVPAQSSKLPTPMMEGNEVSAHQLCYSRDQLHEIVQPRGFEWVNDVDGESAQQHRQPKWGWASETPGASLTIQLNTSQSANTTTPVTVMLALLHSWHSVGKARVECAAGCKCRARTVDLAWSMHATMPNIVPVEGVSQSPSCQVTLTVLAETSTGGHRVKLVGVMMHGGKDFKLGNSLAYGNAVTA